MHHQRTKKHARCRTIVIKALCAGVGQCYVLQQVWCGGTQTSRDPSGTVRSATLEQYLFYLWSELRQIVSDIHAAIIDISPLWAELH